VKHFSNKQRIVVAAAFVLLALFLLRPGASGLKSRIIFSISSAVGRPVDIGAVHLRLLPWPGFDLKDLVVYDDPAFGAEPMLRAGEVTAALRLTSLLRGRLEIARLDLTEPSLNLVHAPAGRWNVEALLERSAHIPLAPTGKAKSESRQGFPYIEATSARINFKSGPEKTPYALTNADFSLWQDSENSWGMRLKAQPFRTDLNLNDMGLLQVSGTWQRAAALRDTPLQLSMEWNRAQLGQFTKFFTGNDQGWRGEILFDAIATGTPADLQVTSNASIQDFRRYDIASGQPLRLATACDAAYSSVSHSFHQILCKSPVATGLITLKGSMGLPGSRNYELVLTAESIPANTAAMLAQRIKGNLPDDLLAGGTVRGMLRISEKPGAAAVPQFEGRGELSNLRLSSPANKADIGAEAIPFLLTSDASPGATSRRRQPTRKNAYGIRFPEGPRLEFGPFPVAIGRVVSPTARGWVNRSGYDLALQGEVVIPKTLRLARMLGLPALQPAGAEGTAQVDLQIAGSWAASSSGAAFAPQVTGTATLHNVRIAPHGVGGPIDVISADMQLLPDEVQIRKLNATAAGTSWSGSLAMPRGCGTPAACQVQFKLHANQIMLGGLREWVSPPPKERPWYRVLQPKAQTGSPFLLNVRASGELVADRLQAQRLQATRVSAKVDLDSGKLQISELNANVLSGQHRGQWRADFTVKPAVCNGGGTVTAASLADLADVMNDPWVDGTVNAAYQLQGTCRAEFWTSAEGSLDFDMRDGTLPHLSLGEDAGPVKVTHFAGQARLHDGQIEMTDAILHSSEGKFQLSGTATLKGELDLKLARTPTTAAAAGYTVTGTLAEPRVIRLIAPETQARLKAEAAK